MGPLDQLVRLQSVSGGFTLFYSEFTSNAFHETEKIVALKEDYPPNVQINLFTNASAVNGSG